MMRNEVISRRYADAYLETARESIGIEKGLEELQDLKRVLRENPEVLSFMESPQISEIEKCDFIDTIFRQSFSEETRQFLILLLKKGRINILSDISEYARVKYAHGVEIGAVLKTSYPLETAEIQSIKDALERRFNNKLHMYIELDADLLGGIYVKIENTIIDGSVRRRLEDLKDKLITVKAY
jgi:F-type H+-transporting ATPase subunit delta